MIPKVDADQPTFWRLLGYGREDDAWDFKRELGIDDKTSLARFIKDVLAFSNYGGGHILLGIDNNTRTPIGVSRTVDTANLGEKIEKATGFTINLKLQYFARAVSEADIQLGILAIPPASRILAADRNLHDTDGKLVIQEGDIFFRRNTRSVRASSEDIQTILARLEKLKVTNKNELADELSLQLAFGEDMSPAIELSNALERQFEPSASSIGRKLRDAWIDRSRYTKLEFGKLIGVGSDRIDDVFSGRALLDLSQLIVATKLLGVPIDYFFRATYQGQILFWENDVVRAAIFSLIRPARAIQKIVNPQKFYSAVFFGIADGIRRLHKLLYSNENIETLIGRSKSEWDTSRLEAAFAEQIANQYYKLLEQYPSEVGVREREFTISERIVISWFYASPDYLARVIVEAVDDIRIDENGMPLIKLRFVGDIMKSKVTRAEYDPNRVVMKRLK